MREIKFRAWDNVTDEMFYCGEDVDILFTLGSAGIECADIRNVSPSGDGVDDMEHLKYMQFTGLTDKNGTEIYEGDLISVINDTFQAEVIYEAPSFKLKWRDDFHVKRNAENKTIAWNAHIIYEVVGNIYQDKHLMEGE